MLAGLVTMLLPMPRLFVAPSGKISSFAHASLCHCRCTFPCSLHKAVPSWSLAAFTAQRYFDSLVDCCLLFQNVIIIIFVIVIVVVVFIVVGLEN